MFLLGILVALSVDFGSIIYDVLVSIVMLSRAAAKTIVKKDVSAVTYSSHFKLLHKYSTCKNATKLWFNTWFNNRCLLAQVSEGRQSVTALL